MVIYGKHTIQSIIICNLHDNIIPEYVKNMHVLPIRILNIKMVIHINELDPEPH